MFDESNYKKRFTEYSWRVIRAQAKTADMHLLCWACDGKPSDLNHRHYKSFGSEVIERDLNWFCRKCHIMWTKFYAKNSGLNNSEFRYEVGNDWIKLQRKNNRLRPLADHFFQPIFEDQIDFKLKLERKLPGTKCLEPTKKGFCQIDLDSKSKCHFHGKNKQPKRGPTQWSKVID